MMRTSASSGGTSLPDINLYKSGARFTFPGDSGFSASAQAQNVLVAIPFFIQGAKAVTFASYAVSVTAGVAGATIRLGAYAPASDGGPGALLADLGTVDASSAGVKTISSPFTLQPGLNYIAAVAQGAAPTVRVAAAPSQVDVMGLFQGSQGSLAVSPATTVQASAAAAGALPNPFGSYSGGGNIARPLLTVQ